MSTLENLFKNLLAQNNLEFAKPSITQIVFDSLQECNPNNEKSLYPAHTTEMILLALIYKKCSYNRNMFKTFYDELNNSLNLQVLTSNLDDTWTNDKFDPAGQAEALEKIRMIFSTDPELNLDKNFADLVYYSQQIREFPKPIGFKEASYEYENNKKTEPFPDCMCNTMRNFINLFAYDAVQNKFTVEKLLANIGKNYVHPTLENFIKLFDDVNQASSLDAHNAWIKIISNIPYAAYDQKVDGATDESSVYFGIGKGYITIPESEQSNKLRTWLLTENYQVLENGHYGYELQPSVKNIIIVLDHLLALNLFTDAGGLAKEFMRADFIKEYFPKLLTTLKATGFLTSQENGLKAEKNMDFDVLDYGTTTEELKKFKIFSNLTLAGITCKFITHSGHGELEFIKIETNTLQELQSLFEHLTNFTNKPTLSYLTTNIICHDQVSFDHLRNNPDLLYMNLFAFSCKNKKVCSVLQEKITIVMNSKISTDQKLEITNFLFQLIKKHPGFFDYPKLLAFLQLLVEKFSISELSSKGIDLKMLTDEALAASTLTDSAQLGHSILKTLFSKGDKSIFKKTLEIAEKTFVSEDIYAYYSKPAGIALFQLLFSEKYIPAFEKALEAADQAAESTDINREELGLNFFKILIETDYQAAFGNALFEKTEFETTLFKKAFKAVKRSTASRNSDVKEAGKSLRKTLEAKIKNRPLLKLAF